MNDDAKSQLLDDVLAESAAPDFRSALLGETLRQARQHRRRRQTRRAGGILMALALTTLFAWQNRPVKMPVVRPAEVPTAKSYQLVETRSLAAGQLVTTKAFRGMETNPAEATVNVVATSGGGFRYINDEQLLGLVEPKPAMLIRTGPNSEELVFAGLEDASSPRRGN